MKASKFASSSGLNLDHNPSLPLNVGTPLSAEMPAPVNTQTERACSIFDNNGEVKFTALAEEQEVCVAHGLRLSDPSVCVYKVR